METQLLEITYDLLMQSFAKMPASTTKNLLDLPSEVLQLILSFCSTPSFLQATLTCNKLFDLAGKNREVVLEHLQLVPGIKLGLEDLSISTNDLFLILRQRASAHLIGVNFRVECRDYRFSNATLDSAASYMTASAEYLNIALAVKESSVLRLYGGRCECKDYFDSPYADGIARIIQVVHHKSTISVLYEWTPENADIHEDSFASVSTKFNASARQQLAEPTSNADGSAIIQSDPIQSSESEPRTNLKYHLFHYNAYNTDRPVCFPIPSPIDSTKQLIPVHLAIANRLQCAIIWDLPKAKLKSSAYTRVYQYKSTKLPEYQEGSYIAQRIYPIPALTTETKDLDTRILPSQPRPRAAQFYKEGRRLKLYEAGSTVPRPVIDTSSVQIDDLSASPYSLNECVKFGKRFRIDTPFYCNHETIYSRDRVDCILTHLCLGIGDVSDSTRPRTLCIWKKRNVVDYDDCRHTLELDFMPHIDEYSRIVARLWGWKECISTLTGLDTVCISKKGTRIAISMWNEVLIWSLDPSVLCEETEDDSDEENEIKKISIEATKFYDLVQDYELGGSIVVLKPIVINLGDSVAKKMMWSCREVEDIDEDFERDVDEESDLITIDDLIKVDHSTKDFENEDEIESIEHNSIMIDQKIPDEKGGVDETTSFDDTSINHMTKESQMEEISTKESPRESSSHKNLEDVSDDIPSQIKVTTFHPLVDNNNSSTTSSSSSSSSRRSSITGKFSKRRRKKQPKIRRSEDELVILTDRGIQRWDLGVWGKGRRIRESLDEKLS